VDVTRLQLPFGHSDLSVQVPTANLLGVFVPQEGAQARGADPFDEDALLRETLAHPIGAPAWT